MRSQSSHISVVAVNHNRRDLLRTALLSLRAQTFPLLEIIVVDNNSSDGSQEMVCREFPEVVLLRNQENCFFAKAYNQGICESRGSYVFCMNNDVVLEKDYLAQAMSPFNRDDRIGMVSGKLLRDDRHTIDSAGQTISVFRKPIERGYGVVDHGQFEHEAYVFGACGAAALYFKEMLEELRQDGEYFDEDFVMFYEDFDLNWRAQSLGWKAFYVPSAIGYHVRGGSAQLDRMNVAPYIAGVDKDLQFHILKNRWLTICKNESGLNFIKNFIFISIYDMILLAWVLLYSRYQLTKWRQFLTHVQKAFRKRKDIQRIIKAGSYA